MDSVRIMAAPYYAVAVLSLAKARSSRCEEGLPEYAAVIPARNEAGYIGRAIESLVAQRHPPRAVHVVDDASEDATLEEAISTIRELGGACGSWRRARLGCVEFYLTECRLLRPPIVFYVWRNVSGESMGKGRIVNSLVLEGYIKHEFFLSLDADTVVEPGFAEKTLRVMVCDESIACVYGYIMSRSEEGTLVGRLYELGRNMAYRMGYLVFRGASNLLGFHYGISGPRVMFRTSIYRRIPRPLDTEAGDTAHAWELQAAGYRVHYEPSTYGVTWEPSTVRGFWRQRLKWHSGPFQNFYLRGFKVLRALRRQGWRRLLAGSYAIFYYVFFSPIYHVKWGVILPLLWVLGVLPGWLVTRFYLLDLTAFLVVAIASTIVLKQRYGYHRGEGLAGFLASFLAFYTWFRVQISLIMLVSLLRTVKDIVLFKAKGLKPEWKHYT